MGDRSPLPTQRHAPADEDAPQLAELDVSDAAAAVAAERERAAVSDDDVAALGGRHGRQADRRRPDPGRQLVDVA